MNGLLAGVAFNRSAAQGLPLREAIMQGAERAGPAGDDDGAGGHLRAVAGGPVDADRLAVAAAAGHRGGRRHDHHAALDYLVPVLYSFYGHREVSAAAGQMAH